jgi:hypothetical protein
MNRDRPRATNCRGPQGETVTYLLLLLLLLGGCSSAIIMRHPDGREADCGGYVFLSPAVAAGVPQRERQCIEDYKAQGYVRVPR